MKALPHSSSGQASTLTSDAVSLEFARSPHASISSHIPNKAFVCGLNRPLQTRERQDQGGIDGNEGGRKLHGINANGCLGLADLMGRRADDSAAMTPLS